MPDQINCKVSVILPTLNDQNFIQECIQSVIEQTEKRWELLVIDGGSTDDTLGIIDQFNDERISVIEGGGFVESLNIGIRVAEGDYIARVDADSRSHPTRFKKQLSFLEQNPDVVAVGSHLKRVDPTTNNTLIDEKPLAHSDIENKLFDASPFAHPTMMFRTNILREIGGYRDYTWEDYELYTRLLDYELANIDEVLVTEHERKDSIQENVSPTRSILANLLCGILAIQRSSVPNRKKIVQYILLFLAFPKKLIAKHIYSI